MVYNISVTFLHLVEGVMYLEFADNHGKKYIRVCETIRFDKWCFRVFCDSVIFCTFGTRFAHVRVNKSKRKPDYDRFFR